MIDEVQKVPSWSEIVKYLWDEDTRIGRPLKVVLLGSSPLLVHRGIGESLAGRFQTIHLPHWSYGEMRRAFGWSVEEYVYYGSYRGRYLWSSDRRIGRATYGTRSSSRC